MNETFMVRWLAVFAAWLLITPSAHAQRFVTSFPTLAQLLAMPLPNIQSTNVQVAGRAVQGDGFEGSFTYVVGSTASTNLGTVFAPTFSTAPAGRWIRQWEGPYQASWFGVKPDGSTDGYQGLTNALAVLSSLNGGTLELSEGTNMVGSPVDFPNAGNRIAIKGSRRDAVLLRATSTHPGPYIMKAAVSGDSAGGYFFEGWTLDGTGQTTTNLVAGLIITNLSSRELTLRDFKIHNITNATGLTVDQTHTVLFENVLIDYCRRAADFGAVGNSADHYFNSALLLGFSAENCTATDWTVRFQNALDATWLGGTVEANGSGVLVTTDSDSFAYAHVYHEDNGFAQPNIAIDQSKGAVIGPGNEFNSATSNTNAIAIRLGSNSYASQGAGFLVFGNTFKQFRGFTIELGGAASGIGPRDPAVRDNFYWDCNQITGDPFKFTDVLETGRLIRSELGGNYVYSTTGIRLANTQGDIAGTGAPVIVDYSGATNFGLALPVAASTNLPNTTKAAIIHDFTVNRARYTPDGITWNLLGYGDGSVQTVSGGTGVVNTVTKWTGNGFQLSTNTIITENGSSVLINAGTNTTETSTKLFVTDGGTNTMLGTSSTVIFRNGGISTNANILELSSNAGGGSSFAARNDGSIGFPLQSAGRLAFINLSTNIATVTNLVGLTFDPTNATLTATGGAGATNAYNLVEDEGTPLTQRTTLNFAGAGVTATDSGGKTLITIPGGGSSAPTNTLVSLSTPSTSGGLWYASDAIGTNATAATGLTVSGGTALNITGALTGGGTNVWGELASKRSGTVTSVAATVPGGFAIAGSPITTSGTLAVSISGGTETLFYRGDGTWTDTLQFASADLNGPGLKFYKRGTTGSATAAVAANAFLGSVTYAGWDGSAYNTGGYHWMTPTETWTGSARGTAFHVYTTANTTTTQVRGWTVDQNGQVIPLVSSSPATTSAGGFAFDDNAWGGARGALQVFDGTANTYAVAALASDAPSNGQVPTWNTGGTVTWETPSGGTVNTNGLSAWQLTGSGTDFSWTTTDNYEKVVFGTSGPSFTLTNAGTYLLNITIGSSDGGTFAQTFYLTNVTDSAHVAGYFHYYVSSPSGEVWPSMINKQITTTGANRVFEIWGQTANGTAPNADVISTNTTISVVYLGNPLGGTGDVLGAASSTDEALARFDGTTGKAIQNSAVTLSDAGVLAGATLDAAANVLKQTKYILFQRPDYGDGVGAIPQTNTYTASGLMHYTFSGSAETNVNWVVYEADVPPDIDTGVAMTATLAFISGGTDADDVTFHITYALGAAGTALPTGTAIATSPIVMTVTPTTPASGDVQTTAAVTLTGWAASMTAGTPLFIRVARLNTSNDDTARDMYLRIAYGSTL